MDRSKPYTITISRQIGSGGAYIGQQLAKKLGIYYADREILGQAAKRLSVLEKDIVDREEKIQSFWETYFQVSMYATDVYLNPQLIKPTTLEIFEAESEIIQRIASEQSSVIIGRCGFHILGDFPNKVSVFLHADKSFRCKRIQELNQINEAAAIELIERIDKERTEFVAEYTKTKWADANHFDLCMDTGKIGLDKCVEILANSL